MICAFDDGSVSLMLSQLSHIKTIINEKQSSVIYSHPQLGRVLIINDEIQHVEKWAPLYHECIVHIPMMFIPKPQTVLILGGGDLFAAAEVLKYPTIKRLDLCDHDKDIVDFIGRTYDHGPKVINDTRFCLHVEDAFSFIDSCQNKYDLVINDCFDSIGNHIEDYQIFKKMADLLSDQGVCSDLIYRHIFEKYTLDKTKKELVGMRNTILSLVCVPEYPGVLHLLTMWGDNVALSQSLESTINEFHLEAIKQKESFCEFFSPEFCRYYLYLPEYIKKIIRLEKDYE